MYRIQIEKINEVLCAKVGCQQFFYFTPEALVADLAFYLKGDPGKIRDAYFAAKRKLEDNRGSIANATPAEPPNAPDQGFAERPMATDETSEGPQPA